MLFSITFKYHIAYKMVMPLTVLLNWRPNLNVEIYQRKWQMTFTWKKKLVQLAVRCFCRVSLVPQWCKPGNTIQKCTAKTSDRLDHSVKLYNVTIMDEIDNENKQEWLLNMPQKCKTIARMKCCHFTFLQTGYIKMCMFHINISKKHVTSNSDYAMCWALLTFISEGGGYGGGITVNFLATDHCSGLCFKICKHKTTWYF